MFWIYRMFTSYYNTASSQLSVLVMKKAQKIKNLDHRAVRNSPCDYTISFITRFDRVMEHHHNTYKVTVSLDKPVDFEINGQSYRGVRGYIMNQNVKHTCAARGATVLVNFIETNSFLGWQIRSLLNERPFINISELLDVDAIGQVLPLNYDELSDDVLVPCVRSFLHLLLAGNKSIHVITVDERIDAVLKYIDANLHQNTVLADLSPTMNLSPGRLRHLFAEQMGIPFSQYILWKRIRNTLTTAVLNGISLTEACHQFGFTDQPHFNRVFRRVFGMNPMMLLNHARMML